MALDPHCFVFDTKAGSWNDAKIDLFYLAVVTEMYVVPGGTDLGETASQVTLTSA